MLYFHSTFSWLSQIQALHPAYANVSTPTELWRTEIAVNTLGCMELITQKSLLEGSGGCHRRKRAQLFKQIAV